MVQRVKLDDRTVRRLAAPPPGEHVAVWDGVDRGYGLEIRTSSDGVETRRFFIQRERRGRTIKMTVSR
jgi:hypothetical protein